MTSRVRADTCTRCGGGLTFAGFDTSHRRVTICLNSLSAKRNDGTFDSIPCNGNGEFVIGLGRFKNVNWMRKEEWSR